MGIRNIFCFMKFFVLKKSLLLNFFLFYIFFVRCPIKKFLKQITTTLEVKLFFNQSVTKNFIKQKMFLIPINYNKIFFQTSYPHQIWLKRFFLYGVFCGVEFCFFFQNLKICNITVFFYYRDFLLLKLNGNHDFIFYRALSVILYELYSNAYEAK